MAATDVPASPAVGAVPVAVRGTQRFSALGVRDFRSYYLTGLMSMIGDNVEHIISYWVMFQAFNSPVLAGFAVISHWTPSLILSVYFGALADRYDRRRIIQFGQLLFMISSLCWGILFLSGQLQVWHAVVLLVLHGLAGALWSPAGQLVVHDMVGPAHLPSAVRLTSMERHIAVLVGPGLGGLLLITVGPAFGLLLNACMYLPLTLWTLTVPYSGLDRRGAPPSARGLHPREVVDVLRMVYGHRQVFAMVALAGLSSMLVGNAFQAQMPNFAHDLGTDEAGLAYSALVAAVAIGALTGGFLLEGVALIRTGVPSAIIATMVWGVTMAGFAFATSYPVAWVLLFIAGAASLAASSMAQTVVQLGAPANVRGRVMGLFNMAQGGMRVGSGLTVGVAAGLIGIHWSLGLSSLGLLAVAVGVWIFARQAPRPAGVPA